MRPNYFFNNPDELVNHILAKLPEPPGFLSLNLKLYFLFSTYTAAYNSENNCNLNQQPKFIADLTFTADKYGPQDYSIKQKWKTDIYQPKEYTFTNDQVDQNIKHFIDDILEQLKDIDDFSLLDRAVQDEAWRNAYTNSESKIMSRKQMILDYQD